MARSEGFRGMMKGNGANVIRIVPNSAMKFLCYERMVQFILEKRREQDPTAEMTPVLRLGVRAPPFAWQQVPFLIRQEASDTHDYAFL